MQEELKLNLQLFGEGDGGDGGAVSTGEGAVESGDNIPAFIPEKARANYAKAMKRMSNHEQNVVEAQTTTEEVEQTNEDAKSHVSYEDLIKSDEYKDEHKAYMDKTIGNRLKKYKGMEESYTKASDMLNTVAAKYGVDPTSEDFLDVLKTKIDEDDSYYEQYAMEHDITPSEARRVVTMERKLSAIEETKAREAEEEQSRMRMQNLLTNAEKTKAQFPGFDLDLEMQDERFRRLCAVNGDDTTAAYMACHWDTILPTQIQMAAQQIQAQTARTVASNVARPSEAGLSSKASTIVEQDFKHMNLEQLRAYADEQRRKQRR